MQSRSSVLAMLIEDTETSTTAAKSRKGAPDMKFRVREKDQDFP